ncbi:MAG: phage tail tube protein [Clostridiales bacterium]|nr:phage tail tube protein [Clostridiales bacterium]
MTYTQTLKAWDAINGAMGCVYAKVDGSVEEMFYVKDIEAVITKKKSEIKVLGYVGTKTKATGWSGSGTLYIRVGKRNIACKQHHTILL